MGRQINFFLHPDDQKDFDNLFRSFDDICFLSYYHKTAKPTIIDDTVIRDQKVEGSRVYLARKGDLENLNFTFIEKFNYWLIDDSSNPLLHFDRCVSFDNYITSGRLYFQPKYVKNLQWISQSEDFVKWSDKIISHVRKKLRKYRYKYENSSYEYTAYLGEHAMNLLEDDKAEISLPGDKLILK